SQILPGPRPGRRDHRARPALPDEGPAGMTAARGGSLSALDAAALGERTNAADPTSLEAMMTRFLDGDPRAFDELFRRLSPRVVGLLRALSGDPRLAEDLAQTTFL